jgi:hypothetical protein
MLLPACLPGFSVVCWPQVRNLRLAASDVKQQQQQMGARQGSRAASLLASLPPEVAEHLDRLAQVRGALSAAVGAPRVAVAPGGGRGRCGGLRGVVVHAPSQPLR